MAISHVGHNHPATPAGRAACRKLRNSIAAQIPTDIPVIPPAEIKMTGPVARRMAKHAVKADRIQPRRSGARVAARSSACVQAALHVDAHGGRCACGWTAVG